jgi:predicted AAA+ superfamily ATPase
VYERSLIRPLSAGKKSVLLLGPRQVGKSTLLASLRPELSLNLASPATFRDYVAHPERLEAELRAARPAVRTVLVDEIQRVPQLLDAIQVLLDEMPGRFRFLLSGSSARKLRRGHANLLPGRVQVHYLHPLLAVELGADFNLDRALAHGTLPGVYAQADPAARAADLRSYVDSYLCEEIQAEALVRDVGGYARLLELVAASSGLVLNLKKLCDEAGVRYESARRYLDVIEDTLVGFRVPAWRGSDRHSLVAHPRFFLFDLGVRNALLRRPLDVPLDDERGLLLEHFVAYEIYRRTTTVWPEARLYHFRTRHGAEVDFAIQVGKEIWGVEVKASRNTASVKPAAFDSLAVQARGLKRRLVVFLGPRRKRLGDVEVLPLAEFLAELPG